MQLLQPVSLDQLEPCPYLPGRQKRFEYFFAVSLSDTELTELLESGWRKFGPYFFRPSCPGCRSCIPLRVPIGEFAPSRSQRRVLRRNSDLRISFGPLRFDERVYQLYLRHSEVRFGLGSSRDEFASHFYLPSCPVLQSEVHLGDELVAVGFLDRGSDALSSVYFCFDPDYSERSLGTFGALAEIEHCRQLGLDYYYLGYLVEGCGSMLYKDHFRPREYYDWQQQRWLPVTTPPLPLVAADSD